MSGRARWGTDQRTLRIFLSSPSDTAAERAAADAVIRRVSEQVARSLGFALQVVRWEDFRPRGKEIGDFVQEPLEQCDLFVMIVAHRFGSPPSKGSGYTSGTLQEYELARKRRADSGIERPEIFTYFRKLDPAFLADPGPQLKQVLEFRREVSSSLFYFEYPSAEAFPYAFESHLVQWVMERAQGTAKADKKRLLRDLFAFGAPPNEAPRATIVYPPRDDAPEDPTHLLPYLVSEDFQAIHKLTKCANIVGLERISAVTYNLFDAERDRAHNTVFICLPRNKAAQRALKLIARAGDKPSFELITEKGRRDKVIRWQRAGRRKAVLVRSPQSVYLKQQRRSEAWKELPAACVARDYAVVARFPSPHSHHEPDLEHISTVFLFGIRGLGTWGAAWCLDHQIGHLREGIDEDGPFQVLLEVTYRDARIRQVRDVSKMDQKYFDQQIDPVFIQQEIDRIRDGAL